MSVLLSLLSLVALRMVLLQMRLGNYGHKCWNNSVCLQHLLIKVQIGMHFLCRSRLHV